MNRNGAVFLVGFLATVVGVGWFVFHGQPERGVAFGTLGILAHWLASRRASANEEVADASYFFGFLLTLVFLAVGLYRLGQAQADRTSAPDVMGFLEDLAAGLILTIVGLLVRQVRTLGTGQTGNSIDSKLDKLIEIWGQRPELRVMEALAESREATTNAAAELNRQVAADMQRLRAAIKGLDDSATSAIEAITKASGQVGDAFLQGVERLNAEVQALVDALAEQRRKGDESLSATVGAATRLRESADASLQQHLKQWTELLQLGATKLSQAHQGLSAEYSEGLVRFAEAGKALAGLTRMVLAQVESLPDPSDRLKALWTGVAQLEGTLRLAVAGSVARFEELQKGSHLANQSLVALASSVNTAEESVKTGASRMSYTLAQELARMNKIVEDYLSLLASTVDRRTER